MRNIIISIIFIFIGYQCSLPIKRKITLEGCDTVLINRHFSDTLIPIYNVDNIFFNYLDTIIRTEKQCAYFNECLTGFELISYLDNNGTELLNIETIPNKYVYDYSKCKGIFIYNNFHFILSQTNIPILNATDSLYSQKYLKQTTRFIGHDDRWSAWTFELKDKNYIFKDHFQCEINVR